MNEIYGDLTKLISFEGFDYDQYLTHEKEILQPRMEKLGYSGIEWYKGETDSFGPLTRICMAISPENRVVWFVYG